MTEYKNISRFVDWLNDNMCTGYNITAVLDDLIKQHSETGNNHYELPGYETRSGNPETYCFESEYTHHEKDDSYDLTIIF